MTTVSSPEALARTQVGRSRIVARRIALGTVAAAALAATANSVVRMVAVAAGDVPSTFQPLQAAPPITTSVVSAVGAAVVLAIVSRFARDPRTTFWRISWAVFALSFVPLIWLATAEPTDPGMVGATPYAIAVLAVMHVVAFVTIVPTLLRLSLDR